MSVETTQLCVRSLTDRGIHIHTLTRVNSWCGFPKIRCCLKHHPFHTNCFISLLVLLLCTYCCCFTDSSLKTSPSSTLLKPPVVHLPNPFLFRLFTQQKYRFVRRWCSRELQGLGCEVNSIAVQNVRKRWCTWCHVCAMSHDLTSSRCWMLLNSNWFDTTRRYRESQPMGSRVHLV
jgi:hypothetical protein